MTSSPKPPPNYSSRPIQYKLLLLVFMLMAVLLMMFEAAKPKNWEWMWQFSDGGSAQSQAAESATTHTAETARGPIDNRLPQRVTTTSHPPDSFQSPLPHSEVASESDFQKPEPSQTSSIDAIDPALLGGIQDDTYFRAEENSAWFALLGALQNASADAIQSQSAAPISFAQLFRQTQEFRGQIVTISGDVRRIYEVPAASNNLGIETYWQCWVRPTDGSNSPLVVYLLDLPTDLEPGTDIRKSVDISGFCFKRWAYTSETGPRIAPVLLAKTAEVRPTVSLHRPQMTEGDRRSAVVVAMIFGLVIAGGALLASRWKAKRFVQQEKSEVAALAASLKDVHIPSVGDQLRELESKNE